MTTHSSMTGTKLHHPYHYVQDADPGAVGADKWWFEPDRGWLYQRNAANSRWVPIAGGYLDVVMSRSYGAVGDGSADDTSPIAAAMTDAGADRIVRLGPTPGYVFKITDELTLPSRTQLFGWSKTGSDGGSVIRYYGADGKHAIKTDRTVTNSRPMVIGVRLEDHVSGGVRTSGNGFMLERCENGMQVKDCYTSGFVSGYYLGYADSATTGDSTHVEDCWATSFGTYGINIERLANASSIRNILGDAPSGSSAVALIRVGTGGADCQLDISSAKYECGNSGHLLYIDSSTHPMIHARNLVGRANGPGPGPGGSVIKSTAGNAKNVVAHAISASTNFVNLVDIDGLVTIANDIANGNGLPEFIGGIKTNGPRRVIGKIRYYGGTGTPEGSVTAPVGSRYDRDDGTAGTLCYFKATGTGNTGWVAVY